MDVSKHMKKSGESRKRARAVWEYYEKEWAENQPEPSSSRSGPDEQEPASLDFIFEDEEDCYDDTDCVVIEDDWHEDASKDEDVRIDADNAPESNEYAKRLRIWALSHNITHTALSALLNIPEIPIMVLGIYCGMAKPDNVEGFLLPLVTEINHILVQGTLINETVFDIRLRAFIADTPARAFMKGVKSFNSPYGCIKCKIVGTYIHEKKTIFEEIAKDRTDEEFRSGVYKQHQICYTLY
uniref:Transposase domain-containing protein n=1 Tax=Anopheles funestus TaxID=62324 RepID=A0A182RMF5_ANOFN